MCLQSKHVENPVTNMYKASLLLHYSCVYYKLNTPSRHQTKPTYTKPLYCYPTLVCILRATQAQIRKERSILSCDTFLSLSLSPSLPHSVCVWHSAIHSQMLQFVHSPHTWCTLNKTHIHDTNLNQTHPRTFSASSTSLTTWNHASVWPTNKDATNKAGVEESEEARKKNKEKEEARASPELIRALRALGCEPRLIEACHTQVH